MPNSTESTDSKRPTQESAVYSMTDVAGLFGVGYTTLWTLVQDETFPVKPMKIGRIWKFRKRDIDRLLNLDNRDKAY